MKLLIRKAGNGGQTTEINIRNPKAVVSNLRAALAILLKMEPHAFRISAGPSATFFDDDKQLLSEFLKDGDTVTVTAKREREDEANAQPDTAASSSSAPPSSTPAPSAPTTTTATSAFTPDPAIAQQLKEMGFQEDLIPLALQRSNNRLERASELLLSGTLASSAAPTRGSRRQQRPPRGDRPNLLGFPEGEGSSSSSSGEEGEEDEEEEWEDDDSEVGEEHEDGDESLEAALRRVSGDEAAGEQVQLLSLLSELYPDHEGIIRRFEENPQGLLVEIQNSHPELFSLISRNHEFFLHFMQDTGSEEDEEEDFDDDALPEEGSSEEAPLAAPVGVVPSTSPSRELSERDRQQIESLTQLGFTQERATEAYLRHGRNPDRAAAWLFDNPA